MAAHLEVAIVLVGQGSGGGGIGGDFAYYPMDDGLEFEMHGYLDMAQGMLVDPPQATAWIEDEYECEVSLWSY